MKIVVSLFISIPFFLIGQDGDFRLGARMTAMGGIGSTVTGPWGLFNNIAGIGSLKQPMAMVGYQSRFNLKELQSVGAGFVYPMQFVNAGVSFFRFGDDIFNEQNLSIALASSVDRVSLGIAINHVQYHVHELSTRSAVVLEFGGIVMLMSDLYFGVHFHNITQSTLEGHRMLPTIARLGLAYMPIKELSIHSEVCKDLDFEEVFRVGLEYGIIENMWVRTGFNTLPFKASFGVGFSIKFMRIDYSFSDQSNLGGVHEISISYHTGE